jgi:hypothetical protein
MGKRRKRKKQANQKPAAGAATKLFLEYYQPAFVLFHQDLEKMGYDAFKPHEIARSFWNVVPPGGYDPLSARPLLEKYLEVLEARLAEALARHSIAYWLHSYRRVFPGHAGGKKNPHTVRIVRGTLEAAIRKHAKPEPCDGVGFSDSVGLNRILNGILLHPKLKPLAQGLDSHRQLVLTNFDVSSLRELYQLEKLAYQIWRAGAALRIVGKGAGIVVDPEHPEGFYDSRSEELDRLVQIYDSRLGDFTASSSGLTFDSSLPKGESSGTIFIGSYNVTSLEGEIIQKMFRVLGLELKDDFRPNFVWAPFNLGQYCLAHRPFSGAFQDKYGFPLNWVFAVVGALFWRVLFMWREDSSTIHRHWQRAYEGPYTRSYVVEEIKTFLAPAIRWLGLPIKEEEVDIMQPMQFLELNESHGKEINLRTRGPVSLFLPYGEDRLFIDYCWVLDLLYNLFFDVVPADQNFKGDALEEIVRQGKSALPVRRCKSLSGEERQVDAAFDLGSLLVIAECRVFARSFGVDLGDSQAIRYRSDRIEAALREVDSKANWLARNPKGTNYDISHFGSILPVAVTPFVEYIPSEAPFYWLEEGVPRVLTPEELRDLLKGGRLLEIAAASPNTVYIRGPKT